MKNIKIERTIILAITLVMTLTMAGTNLNRNYPLAAEAIVSAKNVDEVNLEEMDITETQESTAEPAITTQTETTAEVETTTEPEETSAPTKTETKTEETTKATEPTKTVETTKPVETSKPEPVVPVVKGAIDTDKVTMINKYYKSYPAPHSGYEDMFAIFEGILATDINEDILFNIGDHNHMYFSDFREEFIEAYGCGFDWKPNYLTEYSDDIKTYGNVSDIHDRKCVVVDLKKLRQSIKEVREKRDLEYSLISNAVSECGIYKGMLVKDAIAKFNTYICNACEYDYTHEAKTIAELFINQKAVCHGYALVFEAMCKYCGIDASYVSGNIAPGSHAWNTVTFSDGTVREVDVCWADTSSSRTKFLLITAEQMDNYHNN